jgi:rubrerythrin
MTIEEAIKTAIEYEKRVRDVYVEALDESTDAVARRIFQLMADEEHNHVLYLEAKLGQWITKQELFFEDLDTALPSKDTIQGEVEKLEETLFEKTDHAKELQLLEKARVLEIETSDYYRKLVEELPENGQAFFKRFLEIEDGHLGLVQAEIDALNGPGYWFDIQEFEIR